MMSESLVRKVGSIGQDNLVAKRSEERRVGKECL